MVRDVFHAPCLSASLLPELTMYSDTVAAKDLLFKILAPCRINVAGFCTKTNRMSIIFGSFSCVFFVLVDLFCFEDIVAFLYLTAYGII